MVDTAAEGGVIALRAVLANAPASGAARTRSRHVTRPLTDFDRLAAFDEDTVDPNVGVENAKLALQRLRAAVRGVRGVRAALTSSAPRCGRFGR